MSKDKFDLSRVSQKTLAAHARRFISEEVMASSDGETVSETLQAVIDEARVPPPTTLRQLITNHFDGCPEHFTEGYILAALGKQEARIDLLEEVRKAAAAYLVADYSMPVRTRFLHALADYDDFDKENGK